MNDVKFALRRLWKNPLHLVAGLAAFVLGIGVNTAMFSVSDALLFRPVDLQNVERLVVLEPAARGVPQGLYETSPADYLDYKAQLKSFDDLAVAADWNATLTRDGEPEQWSGFQVSVHWLDVVGSKLVLGRGFRAGEDEAGANRVVVLSHGVWVRRFGADEKILGRQIILNGKAHEVVGVLQDTSRFPAQAQVFAPLAVTPEWKQRRTGFELLVAGRLKAGATVEEAQSELSTVQARLAKDYSMSHEGRTAQVTLLRERVIGSNDLGPRYVQLVLFATAFVLLIAVANVTNLQLARVTRRSREFAIQGALGASRWQVARQVLVESVLLAVGGALLGCVMAVWCVDLLQKMVPGEVWQFLPMWPHLKVNGLALAVTAGIAVLAGLAAGLLPAWVSLRGDVQESLREGGRAMSAGRQRQWLRNGLVLLQMTLALVLLIGAGLMVRGSRALIFRAPEKELEKIASIFAVLPETKYPQTAGKAPARVEFYRNLEAKLREIPGQQGVAMVNYMPYADNLASFPVVVDGRPEEPLAQRNSAVNVTVSPGYFELMRVPLLEGRLLSEGDGAEQDSVCVVDRSLATILFGKESALGRSISPAVSEERQFCRVVGVVAPQVHSPWDRSTRPALYRPFAQARPRAVTVLVRGNTAEVLPLLLAAKSALLAVDPEQPVSRIYSVQEVLTQALAGLHMVAMMMGGIGMIALILACVGIYSVMAYTVEERTSEIGMRMAMGAGAADVFRVVAIQSLTMGALGILLGLGIGYGLAQVFSGLIFGVSASDFWSLSSVSLLLAAVGLLAVYIPARKAIQMDPIAALRHD